MMQTIMALADGVLLPISLWAVMFTVGLGLVTADFHRVISGRKAFLVGAGSMLFVVPAIGIGLASIFGPTPALTVGLILLATTPGGILSNLLTDIADGDVALSVSLSLFLSVVYIFTLPFIAHAALLFAFGESQAIAIPLSSSMSHILVVTLVPVTCGMIVRRFLPRVAERLAGPVKSMASTALVVVFGLICFQQFDVLKSAFGPLMAIVVGMNILAFTAALSLSRLFRLSRKETIAVSIEHLIRQEATAIFVAVTLLHRNDMSLPMIINTFIGMILCVTFVTIMRRVRPEAFPATAG